MGPTRQAGGTRKGARVARALLVGGALVVSAAIPSAQGWRSAATAAPTPIEIGIADHAYRPGTIHVPVGATVTWQNRDEEVHTVTSTAQAFDSKAIDTGEHFDHTFTAPGTYAYFCALHPYMRAEIVVQ